MHWWFFKFNNHSIGSFYDWLAGCGLTSNSKCFIYNENENNGTTGTTILTPTTKYMKSWVGTKYLAFNVPTLFWMLLKRSSACRERSILQTRFILWYMVKVSLQNDTSSKGYLLSATPGQAGKVRGLSIMNRH